MTLCKKCNKPTILMNAYPGWEPDQEPYESGECKEVELGIELEIPVHIQYCENCDKIESIWTDYDIDPSGKETQYNPEFIMEIIDGKIENFEFNYSCSPEILCLHSRYFHYLKAGTDYMFEPTKDTKRRLKGLSIMLTKKDVIEVY